MTKILLTCTMTMMWMCGMMYRAMVRYAPKANFCSIICWEMACFSRFYYTGIFRYTLFCPLFPMLPILFVVIVVVKNILPYTAHTSR